MIRETNMSDGIDLLHDWKTPAEAIESERFDYFIADKIDAMEQKFYDNQNEDGEGYDETFDWDNEYDKLRQNLMNLPSLEILIKIVGYPFSIEK